MFDEKKSLRAHIKKLEGEYKWLESENERLASHIDNIENPESMRMGYHCNHCTHALKPKPDHFNFVPQEIRCGKAAVNVCSGFEKVATGD